MQRPSKTLTILTISFFLTTSRAVAADSVDPDRLGLKAPIQTWDEAIALGNGLTGGLLWGGGNTINLSLDRGDLWDERLPELYHQPNWNYDTICKLKAEGDQAEISRLFDDPYDRVPYPTKLPGGRLVLTLESGLQAESFELDMQQALGRVNLTEGKLEGFFSATQPVAMLRVPGEVSHKFLRPDGLDKLDYPPARFGTAEGMTWMVQDAAEGLTYAVVVASRRTEAETQLAVAITSNQDGNDPLVLGKQRVAAALAAGFDALYKSHADWWAGFWAISDVAIPNQRLQRHYNLVKYFYGAASRPNDPPMPLQAVWTRDDGGLPPWKGDFHHDLNTQMSYLACHTAGLTDAGLSFINYNWDRLPTYRKFARDFYGVEGAAMPGVATLAGKPTAGWSQYALSPTNALWVGQSFYLHWRYTMDREFLANRAYPWLSEIAAGVVNLLEEKDGKLYLPLSSSPEIHNNSLRAWLMPNSNYDLSLMRWAFEALAEMADALDLSDDAVRWRDLRDQLEELRVDDQNVLMFAEGEPFHQSHRHHSHTMAIHPLGTLTVDGSDADRAIIGATLDRMHARGTQQWTGYSFSWFSSLLARAGRAELALKYLVDYERAFILRNGFHVNGDQIGAGLSQFRYRPFTLEGNFLAMEAVHDMLLQSWGDRVRVFPAVSDQWRDVSFRDLRAEGGFKVSAERRGGRTVRVVVTATVDQTLRLVNPFAGAPIKSSLKLQHVDDELRCQMKAGQSLDVQPQSLTGAAQGAQSRTTGPATISLAGSWRFKLDPLGVGEEQKWFAAALGSETIALPGTTDLAGKGYALDRATMTYPIQHLKSGIKYSQGVERLDEVGYLVRDRIYLGKSWYQRTVDIPESLVGKRLQLRLERVNWQSTVWLDDQLIGSCDSLVADHRFDLGWARPGARRLTIRIDNDLIHNIGVIGHAYGPETQSRWNGIVGRIELKAVTAPDRVWIDDVQVYPAVAAKVARVKVAIRNLTGGGGRGTLIATARSDDAAHPHAPAEQRVPFQFGVGQHVSVEFDYPMGDDLQLWDEFHPTRYVLSIRMDDAHQRGVEHRQITFGMRTIERDGRHIKVNGRRIFLRGTLDCCVYPKTGHPPVTVDSWLRVMGAIKQYGFNHVRFHTWCPPDAAFEAADRLGIYLAPETPFWVDDWVVETNPRPKPLGSDPRITEYVRNEIRRISDAYGNHPSFAMFCIGNELGNRGTDWELVNDLLAEAKRHDPRRLFTASTARKRVPSDDVWVTHSAGASTRGVGPAHTDWDFAPVASGNDLPVIAHETGQRPIFPDYGDLLPKFTGPLKPYNLQRFQRMAIDHGIADQISDFERASARFQLVQYKAEHEGMLRTRDYAGYQLLMLNDFTGQSEAHVGMLDPFWESKGVVGVEEVRQWNGPTVALARFERYTWTSDQTFEARLEVAHFGAEALPGAVARWSLTRRDGQVLAQGETDPVDVPCGDLMELGRVATPLDAVTHAASLTLNVTLGTVTNQWPLWVYPPAGGNSDQAPRGVLVIRTLNDEAKAKLASGGRVLLLAQGMQHARAERARNGFESVYWSGGWWGNKFSQLGILCDPEHPALEGFPTASHSDWQWHALTHSATTFDLTGVLPIGYQPIVQAVPDFHDNRLLAHIFEARVGDGRLLVCGYDLSSDLDTRHAARQFRQSVIRYQQSDRFDPKTSLTLTQLAQLVPPR